MTINILEHLENIKIFTDYINSGLDSIEMFWEQIDKGKSIKKDNEKKTKFGLTYVDYMPTEDKISELSENKERLEHIDLCERAVNSVRNNIEAKLDYDYAEIPETIELQSIFETIIEANWNLENYLNTSKDIFNKYAEIIGNDLPSKFFNKLSLFEKESKSKLITSTSISSNSHNENVFSVFEWATIFHYAYEKNLLMPFNTKKETWEQFMLDHSISTSSNTFKTNYYSARKRLHSSQDYPIKKLEKIMPFVEKNYKKALTSLINDKEFLEYEQAE